MNPVSRLLDDMVRYAEWLNPDVDNARARAVFGLVMMLVFVVAAPLYIQVQLYRAGFSPGHMAVVALLTWGSAIAGGGIVLLFLHKRARRRERRQS
jgi:hypothetical protein